MSQVPPGDNQARLTRAASRLGNRRVTLDESDPQSEPLASLVVGFDRRAESHVALRVAADLAIRLSARLYVLHAVDLNDYPVDPDRSDWEDQARQALAQERSDVAAMLRNHTGGWTYQAWPDDPARMLLAAADEHNALMIIVGTRSEGWHASLERLFGPSVSHGVIRYGQRPVLVVGQPAGPPS